MNMTNVFQIIYYSVSAFSAVICMIGAYFFLKKLAIYVYYRYFCTDDFVLIYKDDDGSCKTVIIDTRSGEYNIDQTEMAKNIPARRTIDLTPRPVK